MLYYAGPGWILIGCFERRKNSLCFRIHCKLSWTQTGRFVEEVREKGGRRAVEEWLVQVVSVDLLQVIFMQCDIKVLDSS